MRALPFLLLVLAGCPSVLHFQRADTLGKGGIEAGGDVSALLIVDGDERIPMPWVRGTLRYGLTNGVDLGLSAGMEGGRAEGKFLLHRGPTTAASLSLGLRFHQATDRALIAGSDLTFRFGLDLDRTSQLVFSIRGNQDMLIRKDEGSFPLLYAGGGVGVSVEPIRHLRVMPELGVLVPYFSEAGFAETADGLPMLVQGGVGVVYTR